MELKPISQLTEKERLEKIKEFYRVNPAKITARLKKIKEELEEINRRYFTIKHKNDNYVALVKRFKEERKVLNELLNEAQNAKLKSLSNMAKEGAKNSRKKIQEIPVIPKILDK